jgi:hypothetical protein
MTRIELPLALPEYPLESQTAVVHPFSSAFAEVPSTSAAPTQVFQKQPVIPETPITLRSYEAKLAMSASTPNLNKEPTKKVHSAVGFSMLKYCRLAILVQLKEGKSPSRYARLPNQVGQDHRPSRHRGS